MSWFKTPQPSDPVAAEAKTTEPTRILVKDILHIARKSNDAAKDTALSIARSEVAYLDAERLSRNSDIGWSSEEQRINYLNKVRKNGGTRI